MIRRSSTAAGVALALLSSWADAAAAEPTPADRLPASLLAECDARTKAPGHYDPPTAAAVRALIEMGVFSSIEFRDARIGFCELQRAGGPVAASSCEDGVILLDSKYADADRALVLNATLAHEMLHHLQHRERKARYGDAYCQSARYRTDKPSLEAAADKFGDEVAALFALGRRVEIVNRCDEPVSIYLEAIDPVAIRGTQAAFQNIPALARAMSPERAASGRFRFYAQTTPKAGAARIWQDRASAHSRIVEGLPVRPRETRLAASDRLKSPFRLTLTCAANDE